ncbi:TrkA family potassium uptake protein [Arthrobacter sp. IA7]|uniref:TrkA family potassium uptake protein n=1 Tax=Arthrobacter globiformis TaxID=1665 RepID=A0A328HFQ9_ARTGO|nr:MULTISPECIES: TrkA family potassium uptake protein [Arthrobacter]MBD1541765.1 TrkA family potassium uptake protein [Arthrobacter ipis]RAM35863.1 TrkA family potassium uptake protein [Arthrobacter globiformis]UKA53376.1 TrkA family potassium uptake protein [Arthrobacter sp. FW305-BF8]
MAKNFFSRSPESTAQADSVVVIGLGRFGGSLALELEAQGTEVLGIDSNEDTVQSYNGRLTHVVRADSTKEEVLRQLSVHEFDRAVVGIGSDIEASILTTSRLLTFKKPQIWAKAISEPHAEILNQLGVDHVIRPEHDMGKRVAHLVRGSLLDYVEFEDDFVMIRTSPPTEARDRPLGVLGLRDKYGITIVAVKRPGGIWGHTTAQTVLYDDDQIIVQGSKTQAERFSNLP